jgi:hypothetical protein
LPPGGDARSRPALPKAGDVVAGKYRIEKIVGEGGMGVVYAAHHLMLDQRVALKLLLLDSPHGEETVERFVREARAAARMRSEHVVRVTDAGALESGLPFLVMEYLNGCDLAELLRLEGPMRPEDVADTVLQVLAALAEAHAAGIIHRDLKPANLYLALRDDGTNIIKILDFGISKQKTERSQWKELTGKAVLGTPHYMSPEQLRSSKNVDARADIWSLGVVIHELLTGQLPFDGDGAGEVFAAILEQTPAPVRALRPELAETWDAILTRCLTRLPDSRFADVAELAHAVVPLGSGRWAHLVPAIEQALARGSRGKLNTNAALLSAAVAAAVTSMPPPASRRRARARESLVELASRLTPLESGGHARARETRDASTAALATDKTLLADALPARNRAAAAAARKAIATALSDRRTRITAIGAGICCILAVAAFGRGPKTVAAASAMHASVEPAATQSPLSSPEAAPPAMAAAADSAGPSPTPAPADGTPERSPTGGNIPVVDVKSLHRAPAISSAPSGPKKAGPPSDTRPTFLKSWR